MLAEMILDGLLRTKNITRKDYNTICKKSNFEKTHLYLKN